MSKQVHGGRAVDIILVGYDHAHTRRAVAYCDRIFKSLTVRNRLLVSNGKDLPGIAYTGWTVIRGTNSLGEFSGWQQGLEWLRGRQPATNIVFVNDTMGNFRQMSVLKRMALRRQFRTARGLQCVGFRDRVESSRLDLRIDGMGLPEWVSTYCFLLTHEALERLQWNIYEPEKVIACVPGGSDESRFFSDRLSSDLSRHLKWWLFGGGWRRSERLDINNSERLAFKARCICAEKLLSARCLNLGIAFHDPLQGDSAVARLHRLASAIWIRLTRT